MSISTIVNRASNGANVRATIERLVQESIRSKGESSALKPVMAAPPTIASSTSVLAGATVSVSDLDSVRTVPDQIGEWTYATVFTRGYSVLSGTSGNQDDSSTVGEFEQWAGGCIYDGYLDGTLISIEGLSLSDVLIEVDGEIASLAPVAFGSGNKYINITFPSRAVRRIRLLVAMGAWGIRRIFIEPTARAWATPLGTKCQFVGDSMTEGIGATTQPGSQWTNVFSNLCGFSSVVSSALGGTGYTNDAGGKGAYADRISQIQNPDLLVICGTVNDSAAAAADGSAFRSSVISTLSSARAAAPNAVIAVTGVIAGRWPNDVVCENELKTAFGAWGDPNSLFLPSITSDNGAHIFGTGNTASPAGDGNADIYINSDTVHPTISGHIYIAQRQYDEFIKALYNRV